jgi:hypothetical protein
MLITQGVFNCNLKRRALAIARANAKPGDLCECNRRLRTEGCVLCLPGVDVCIACGTFDTTEGGSWKLVHGTMRFTCAICRRGGDV